MGWSLRHLAHGQGRSHLAYTAVMQYCPEREDHREGIYDCLGRSTSNKKSAKKMRRFGLHVVEVLGKVMIQISRKEDKSLFVSALY
ncbi:hypothetical protein YC2023_070221 [Brassica napus]